MNSNRRSFLKTAAAGTVACSSAMRVANAAAPQKVTVGVIGPGGMGSNHLLNLVKRKDVRIAWVCDVDQHRLGKAVEVAGSTGTPPRSTGDLRKVLDDDTVDAVFIATPDHWHAPAAIMALDAGKHVYVEKPCCHNIREGRLMSDAVKRSGKVLQVGTQSRSTDCVREAMQRVLEGEIGEVRVAKAWNSQRRGSIGKQKPKQPPEHLDFDTWTGPATKTEYRSNLLHGVWRWWYDFGCGDIGNDGVHDIDVALWGLNPGQHPVTAACLGGKYHFEDDMQFPDTQYAVFEYPVEGSDARRKQLIFEQRIWTPYVQDGYENGAAFYGTKGVMICGHTVGWRMYGERNKLIAQREGRADLVAHHDNFFASIRGDAKPNADVTAGHRSATIVHLANIAARTRATLEFDPEKEQITNNETANNLVKRQYGDHWGTPKNV